MADSAKERSDRERCEGMRNWAAERAPFVKFMLEALDKAGCVFDARKHFRCMPCDAMSMGGFDPKVGVTLCQNHLVTQQQVTDTMTHEMVHAYDHCRAKVDWSNCFHHACSEIRAANLSGDCFITKEFMRLNFGVAMQQQACVKRRALLSVKANSNCSPDAAAAAVDAMFDACFNETSPFERIP